MSIAQWKRLLRKAVPDREIRRHVAGPGDDGRPDVLDVLGDRVHRCRVGDAATLVHVNALHDPLEGMGEGEEREGHVFGADRHELGHRQHVADEIRVSEHDPFGVARRPRGVDDARQRIWPDGLSPPLEERRIRSLRLLAATVGLFEGNGLSGELLGDRHARAGWQTGIEHDRARPGRAACRIDDLPELGGGRDEADLGAAVIEHVAHLSGGRGRIDRHAHPPCVLDREVGDLPFGAVLR